MSSLFCYSDTKPYSARSISQEQKFKKLLEWARWPNAETSMDPDSVTARFNESDSQTFVIQLAIVRQVGFDSVESKRYFMAIGGSNDFCELAEDLVTGDDNKFQKLNA